METRASFAGTNPKISHKRLGLASKQGRGFQYTLGLHCEASIVSTKPSASVVFARRQVVSSGASIEAVMFKRVANRLPDEIELGRDAV